MTSTGGYVDISTLLPYLITVVLIGLGFVNFVKFAATKYLNPNIRFEGEENIAEIRLREREKVMEEKRLEVCAVCERDSTKRCSRCKSVKYCSSECQSKHWSQGHKQDCRTATGHAEDTLKNSCNFSNAFRTSAKTVTLPKSSNRGVSLAAANGCSDSIMVKPKKVLFPYEKFVKLFYWKETNFPPCGLINCGNSCFANVVLQCLTYTRPLVAYLLEGIHTQTCRRNDSCFLCELRRHVLRVSQSDEPFQPMSILSHIAKMPGDLSCGRQEDAHEFMSVVVDSMQSILLDEFGGEKALHPDSRETTLIYHIFGGCLRSRVTCTQCLKISDNYDKSLDLIIEIHGDVSSLEDALEKHTSIEWLDGDNKYNCEGCHSYVRAQKQLTIHQVPNILTITLKRYQTGRFGKLNKRVTFPETLDISPYLSEKDDNLHIYKLYAVIVHVDMLNASFFGHYICYVKDLSGSWYRVDDCKVRSVELEEVLSQRGYMLLYSRISALPSPIADIPRSTAINMEKGHLNTSSAFVDFMSKSDAYISSPFEVVTPLRSNLGSVQEGMNENVHVLDGLTTANGVGSIQRPDSVKGSYNSFDTDLSVDFTSEDSGLPTSNSSLSEVSSIVAGNETLDKMLSIDTCLHRTPCPHILDAKNSDKCSPSSVEGNAKQCESTDLQNERSSSVCPLTGLTSLLQQNIDDDTPRTSDLTEDETSRISALHGTDVYVEGPEGMDGDNEVEQSFGNSSHSFNALLTESAIEEIVDCSLQQFPLNNSKTLVMDDDKGVALPSSSFLYCPPVISPDKYTSSLDYKNSFCLPVGRSNVSDAGLMESDKDVCHEFCTQQKVRNVSMPDVINTGIQSTEREASLLSKDQETVPAILPHIHSSSAMDVGSNKLVGWPDRFHGENDMAERSSDSTSELESHEYNHTMVSNEKCQTDQITIFDNNSHGAMLTGSGSFPEICPIEVTSTKVKTSSSNGVPSSEPVKKSIKTKPLFAAGFLNKSPNLHPLNFSGPLQENGNHSVSFSGSSSPKGSNHCLDSRTSLDVSSDEKCSIPLDEAKIASPTCSHFDINSETSGTERVNDTKRKSLFAPGFLNRISKSPAVTQSNASQMGCSAGDVAAVHKTTMVDGTSGIEQFDTSNCKLMSGDSELVDMTAEQKENVEHNQLGNSTSIEKELIIANGKKRTLSSESLHTDLGNSPIVITKGMSNGGRQKQGRNDSCSCGSQRKWKKCCGSADALRQIAGR